MFREPEVMYRCPRMLISQLRATGYRDSGTATGIGSTWDLPSYILVVLDLASQSCDVVLVRRIFSSGKPQGVGILEWGGDGNGDGNGEISLRATWDQGGRDPITARRVPSK
jgi:hypothetical protein